MQSTISEIRKNYFFPLVRQKNFETIARLPYRRKDIGGNNPFLGCYRLFLMRRGARVRSKGAALQAVARGSVPGVQIPSPPSFVDKRNTFENLSQRPISPPQPDRQQSKGSFPLPQPSPEYN